MNKKKAQVEDEFEEIDELDEYEPEDEDEEIDEDLEEIEDDEEIEEDDDEDEEEEVVTGTHTATELKSEIQDQGVRMHPSDARMLQELAELVNGDELIKEIIMRKKQGYAPAQIRQGLAKLWSEVKEEAKTPMFNSVDEEVEYKVNKAIEKYLAPIKQEQERQAYLNIAASITKHNDMLMLDALKESGWSPTELVPDQLKAMNEVIADLMPGQDINVTKFTTRQAKAIINEALGVNKKVQSKPTKSVKSKIKEASAPKILSGKSPKSVPTTKKKSAIDGLTQSERMARYNSLGL